MTCETPDRTRRITRRRVGLDDNGNFVLTVNVRKTGCEVVRVGVEGLEGGQFVTLGSDITLTAALEVMPAWVPKSCRKRNVLCFQDGRFQARLAWRDLEGRKGNGFALPRTANSGVLLFLDPEQLAFSVRVLDACAVNGKFWVFAAADTVIEYTLTVTDTGTRTTRSYSNPSGSASPAISDYEAFGLCGGSGSAEGAN